MAVGLALAQKSEIRKTVRLGPKPETNPNVEIAKTRNITPSDLIELRHRFELRYSDFEFSLMHGGFDLFVTVPIERRKRRFILVQHQTGQ